MHEQDSNLRMRGSKPPALPLGDRAIVLAHLLRWPGRASIEPHALCVGFVEMERIENFEIST